MYPVAMTICVNCEFGYMFSILLVTYFRVVLLSHLRTSRLFQSSCTIDNPAINQFLYILKNACYFLSYSYSSGCEVVLICKFLTNIHIYIYTYSVEILCIFLDWAICIFDSVKFFVYSGYYTLMI